MVWKGDPYTFLWMKGMLNIAEGKTSFSPYSKVV